MYLIPAFLPHWGHFGVANISTYDVGSYRAPQTANSPPNIASTIPYYQPLGNSAAGFSLSEVSTLVTDGFAQDYMCNTPQLGGAYYNPVSWCNLSLNDSYSENNRLFNTSGGATVSTNDAIINFNGQIQLTLPIADSATEWN